MKRSVFQEMTEGFKTHVDILGVKIPLNTLAYCTSTVITHASLGEWNNYYNESSPDIAEAISVFEKMASRRPGHLPTHAGINRQVFQYSELS